MNSESNWAQAAQLMQETLGEGFKQVMEAMGTLPSGHAAGGAEAIATGPGVTPVRKEP